MVFPSLTRTRVCSCPNTSYVGNQVNAPGGNQECLGPIRDFFLRSITRDMLAQHPEVPEKEKSTAREERRGARDEAGMCDTRPSPLASNPRATGQSLPGRRIQADPVD